MIRFNQKLFVASAITLVALTSFKTVDQAAFAKDPAPKPAATAMDSTSKTAPAKDPAPKPAAATTEKTSGLSGLGSVVTKTMSATEAGNLVKAKEEFSKFDAAYKAISSASMKKSPDAFKAIEAGSKDTMKELMAAKPSKTKVLASLQTLDKAIAKAGK